MYKMERVLSMYGIGYNELSTLQKICCPFHNDSNPSMVIDFERDSFFCFGCNENGTSLDFVLKAEKKIKKDKYDDLQACIRYSEATKCNLSDLNAQGVNLYAEHKNKPKIANKQLYSMAYDYYNNLRQTDWMNPKPYELDALTYLLGRGFTCKTLNSIHCKYSFSDSYPIIFPIFENRKFKGYVCRTMDKEIESKRKYLYNKGFRRSETMAGWFGDKDYVLVVEGYMDLLKARQFGEKNAVACLGWKMSDGQFKKLRSAGIKKVVCGLDNDEAGNKGNAYLKTLFKHAVMFEYPDSCKDVGDMTQEQFTQCRNKYLQML